MSIEFTQGEYRISENKAELDHSAIHAYLTQSYWSPGIPLATVSRAIQHSLCFGLYQQGAQVGFARVVSDFATFGYLCDVYVLEAHRGHGLGKWLMQCLQQHPQLQGLRRFMLATRDAHGLYQQFGFTELANPGRLMEIVVPDIYQRKQ
jgi:GNAT superfamily N-acetyltransferase